MDSVIDWTLDAVTLLGSVRIVQDARDRRKGRRDR